MVAWVHPGLSGIGKSEHDRCLPCLAALPPGPCRESASQSMAEGQCALGALGDLMLEFDTVAAVLGYGFHRWEPGKFERICICPPSPHSTRLRPPTAFVLFSFADWEA